jgi:RHS repeat-associated protein
MKNINVVAGPMLAFAFWLLNPQPGECFYNSGSCACGSAPAPGGAGTGATPTQHEYGPFDEVIRATGPLAKANTFRFSTKYQDDETDMVYYGYRYYNASTGRWLSRDLIAERGGKNLYSFVNNSSLNQVDRFGLAPWPGYPGGPWGPGVGCTTCRCKTVEVTYNPGGDVLQLGPYRESLFGIPWFYNYGSAVHVHWNTEGNAPWLCRYYQDEEGTTLSWKVTSIPDGPTGTVVGVNGHVASFDYTDNMGRTFGSLLASDPAGTFKMTVHWNVTFRCESAPGSGGGPVSRHDQFDREATFSVPWW